MQNIAEPCVVDYNEKMELLKAKKYSNRMPLAPSDVEEMKKMIDALLSYQSDNFFHEARQEKNKKIAKLTDFFGRNPRYLPHKMNRSNRVRLSEDVSKGKEIYAIPTFCDVNTRSSDHTLTNGFAYITENCIKNDAKQKKRRELCYSCDCSGPCKDDGCACIKLHFAVNRNGEIQNIQNGRVKIASPLTDTYSYMLLVCGEQCKCPSSCPNRITNISKRFELFRKDLDCGFGIRSLNSIQMGELVSEFTGRVMTVHMNTDIRIRRYAMELFSYANENTMPFLVDRMKSATETAENETWDLLPDEMHIDPYAQGNIARFIQHGCYPNVIPLRVAANYLHPTEHKIYFFAARTIVAGEELFFNYGSAYTEGNKFRCACGTPLCQNAKHGIDWKSLSKEETIDALLELHLDWESQAREVDASLIGEVEDRPPKVIADVDEIIEEEPEKLKKRHSLDYQRPITPAFYSPKDQMEKKKNNFLRSKLTALQQKIPEIGLRSSSSSAISNPPGKENKKKQDTSSQERSTSKDKNEMHANSTPRSSLSYPKGENNTPPVKPRPKMPVVPPLPVKRTLSEQKKANSMPIVHPLPGKSQPHGQETVSQKAPKAMPVPPPIPGKRKLDEPDAVTEKKGKGTAEDPIIIDDDVEPKDVTENDVEPKGEKEVDVKAKGTAEDPIIIEDDDN